MTIDDVRLLTQIKASDLGLGEFRFKVMSSKPGCVEIFTSSLTQHERNDLCLAIRSDAPVDMLIIVNAAIVPYDIDGTATEVTDHKLIEAKKEA